MVQMSTSKARNWVEAAKILAEDPSAVVRYPESDDGPLVAHDQVFKGDPTMMERTLRGAKCGAWNVIRMRSRKK